MPLFCEFQESLVTSARAVPWKMLVPVFVTTLTTAPWKRPYSAETAALETTISWIVSKLLLAPNVPVVGSVVSTPSKRKTLPESGAPRALGLPSPSMSFWPGAKSTTFWYAAADRQLVGQLGADGRRVADVGLVDERRVAGDRDGLLRARELEGDGEARRLLGRDEVARRDRDLEAGDRRRGRNSCPAAAARS